MKFGDRNTKFFHVQIKKGKANMINHIKDERGQLWETQEHIGEAFVGYYLAKLSATLQDDLLHF
jgi:hypothetical protein